jgi:hypothetical protein
VTDRSDVVPTVHPGETGEAIWRTFTIGDLRVRRVAHRSSTQTGAKLFIVD